MPRGLWFVRSGRWTAWGWGLTASTLFHLALLGLGGGQGQLLTGVSEAWPLTLRVLNPQEGAPVRDVDASRPEAPRREEAATRGSGAGVVALPLPPVPPTPPPPLLDFSDYLNRAYLHEAPVALKPIEIIKPDIPFLGTERVELEVYVDEAGTVRRIRVLSAEASGLFAQAAVAAFQTAQFRPGQVNGRPVRSTVKVLVEFHARTLTGITTSPIK